VFSVLLWCPRNLVPVALAKAYGTGSLGVRDIISVIKEGREVNR